MAVSSAGWGMGVLALAFSHAPGAWGQTPLSAKPLVTGLSRPTDLQAPPGDEDHLFLVEQTGTIKVLNLRTGVLEVGDFLDLSLKIDDTGNEQGLLGLAFHPNYADNGYFYVNYTDLGKDTVVERYQRDPANPLRALPGSGAIILGPLNQPQNNHNGGQLQFGPDGFLYVGLGDGGGAGDPNCLAQNGSTLLGKMLRLDIDSGFPYAIPDDNPFRGGLEVRDEIWALGLRNPWRFSFDRDTGDLYIADVGQRDKEEINFQAADSSGGENYGWKPMEGTDCFNTSSCTNAPSCNDPSLVLPIAEYDQDFVGCAVMGGYVYRGCAIPDLNGTYFFADHCEGRLWSFRYDGTSLTDVQERTAELHPDGGSFDRIMTFGEDGCGELYFSTKIGQVFQIVADVPPSSADLGLGKTGGEGRVPTLDLCGLLQAGSSARLRLRDGPRSAPAALLVSDQLNPQPFRGGVLAPLPPLSALPLTTDVEGEFEWSVPGGLGPQVLAAQLLVQDPGASFETGLSNVLLLFLQP